MKPTQVYFVGAGPGDPELITVKGARVIREADVIIYTGSLVNPEVVKEAKDGAVVHDSAGMNLEEIVEIMLQAAAEGKRVARVHTGDPALFGAIREQIDRLQSAGVDCTVIPGVSSFAAAAASLKKEYTLPGVAQTVILTRMEGRTPVPEKEQLGRLAAHGTSLVIFLSVQMIHQVVEALLEGYEPQTPVAVVQKASWPGERIVQGTLEDIAARVEEAGIDRTALILVGPFLGDAYQLSRLYDRNFSHGYRGDAR